MTDPAPGQGASPAMVLVRADASPRIGDGHIMRCLSLADELSRRGGKAVFVSSSLPGRLTNVLEQAGHVVRSIDGGGAVSDRSEDWDQAAWSEPVQRADANATSVLAEQLGATHLVVDHYKLDIHFEANLPLNCIVFDDLANRRHQCATLVDHNLGRRVTDYTGLVPEGSAVLVGPHYAPLRPEFAIERQHALARRRRCGPVDNILISLGSTDVGGITGRVVQAVVDAGVKCPVDVILRAEASSRPLVDALAAENGFLRVHDTAGNMAAMMTTADLAIGAGGTTSWERCTLGLPTICLVLAANQQFVAEQLDRIGAAVALSDIAQLSTEVRRMVEDNLGRHRMSGAAFAVTDGRGAARLVDRLFGELQESSISTLRLRSALQIDSERIWLWRNDVATRENSQNGGAISWQEHNGWFEQVLGNPSRELLVAERDGAPIAVVRFDRTGDHAEVSINLDPAVRRSAMGLSILHAACVEYAGRHGMVTLLATIRRGNRASERIFSNVGFRATGSLSNSGFALYVCPPGRLAELSTEEQA